MLLCFPLLRLVCLFSNSDSYIPNWIGFVLAEVQSVRAEKILLFLLPGARNRKGTVYCVDNNIGRKVKSSTSNNRSICAILSNKVLKFF